MTECGTYPAAQLGHPNSAAPTHCNTQNGRIAAAAAAVAGEAPAQQRWKVAGTVNVLSDVMQFGKLLSRVRNDGRVYLNYKELKQCMSERDLLKEKLKREIYYIDSFFRREEETILRDGPTTATVTALLRLVLINIFACKKIVTTHERYAGIEHSCRSEILAHLQATSFYNAFCSSPVFVQPEVALKGLTPTQLQQMNPIRVCVSCSHQTPHMAQLSSCAHPLCWDCIVKKDQKGLTGCPVCGEELCLPDSSILCEGILGVEPRAATRASRRRNHQTDQPSTDDEDEEVEVPQEEKVHEEKEKEVEKEKDEKEEKVAEPEPATYVLESDEECAASQKNRYFCHECSMTLNSFRQAQIHVNGKRHIDQVARLKERCARDGVEFNSPGLVDYSEDLQIEGHRKARRSRGGAKSKLRAKKQETLDEPPLQQQPSDLHSRAASGSGRNAAPPRLDDFAENTLSRMHSVGSMHSLGDATGMPHVSSWGDLTAQPSQNSHSAIGTPLHPLERSMDAERYPIYNQHQYSQPHTPGLIGPNTSQQMPYSNQPYPLFHSYVNEQIISEAADVQEHSEEKTYEKPPPPESTPAKTHAFQIYRHSSDLRQSIETVIAKKDNDGKAFQKIKTFVVEEDGCSGLVEEVYRGIFNGENQTEYAELCKMVDQSDDPEVTLVRNEFIGLLLRKCKQTVTATITSQPTSYTMSQEQIDAIEEQELRDRFRRAAAVKFSADLFSRNILPVAVVHVCLQTMLYGKPLKADQKGMDLLESGDNDDNQEDNLATACKIFHTVGEKLKQTNPNFLDEYKDALQHFQGRIASSRVKRRVKDILDTYGSNNEHNQPTGADP